MKKHTYCRDLLVYIITSFQHLFLKGHFNLFVHDVSYFNQWRKYRMSLKGTLDHKIPWLVFSSLSFLNNWLKKEMLVFEYGSGGSTLYFAKKTRRVVSIEHNREWYTQTKQAMFEFKLANIEYALVEPQLLQDDALWNCTDPAHYISCFSEYKEYEFSAYAKAIDHYPDNAFDLVMIDGRVRPSCIFHSMRKIKQHGILLLDNADRIYYLQPFPQLLNQHQWKEFTFIGHFPYGSASVLNTTKMFVKL